MSLYSELKRRKVVRVVLVYCATAFVVLQAADLMLPRMGVPDWAMSLVVALAVLGLPIALVLAWALELTPEGVGVTRGATAGSGDPAPPALLGGRTIVVVALLVAVGAGLGAGLILAPRTGLEPGDRRAADPDPGAAHERSIAVLPFADFSPGGGQGWFYDDAGEIFALSAFLDTSFFDPRAYPNLSAVLRRHGALRTEPLPIPYACPSVRSAR